MSDPNADNDEERLPASKEALLERIQAGWTDLEAVIAALSEEAMASPGPGGWSVKDNLAHLAAWEQFMLGHYLRREPAHQVMGLDDETYRGLDEDGVNQVIYERNRDRSTSAVLDDFRRSHAQVVEVLQAISWEDLMVPNPTDQQGRPVLEWVTGNTYEHYSEHLDNIISLQTPSALGD